MRTGIKDFCLEYIRKLKNDKDIKENKVDIYNDFRDRIRFNLSMYSTSPNSYWIGNYNGKHLFTLDEEDLEYLYKKYSKKVEVEMEQNIATIKEAYKKAINK